VCGRRLRFCLETELSLGFYIISSFQKICVVFRRIARWMTIIFLEKLGLCLHSWLDMSQVFK
jgi:hypothetical protein